MTTAVSIPATFSALANPDLLRQVLQGASVGFPEWEPIDFANAASTCRAFREPALDSLWHELTSFIPLLRLIPGFTILNGLHTLLGPLSPSDFVRFDHHARRVRSVDLSTHLDVSIDTSVFIRIAQHHPEPILPLLQKLQIWSSAHLNASLPLLLTPTLHHIDLNSDFVPSDDRAREETAFAVFLSMVAHSFPRALDHLVLGSEISPVILDLIPRFDYLRTLDIERIHPSVTYSAFLKLLHSVSSSLHLTSLIINDLPPWSSWQSPPSFEAAFPALKTLKVSGELEFLERFINGLGTSSLRNLTVGCQHQPTRWADEESLERWRLLFAHIAVRWQSSLAQIAINIPGKHLYPTGFLHLFRGFCSLGNLQEFSLYCCPVVGLDNNAVRALAIGCPCLQKLGLAVAVTDENHQITLPGIDTLLHLVSLCPCLRELELSLDLDRELTAEIPSTSTHCLKILTIHSSHRPGVLVRNCIAKVLDGMFPALKSFYGQWAPGKRWSL